MRSWSNFPTSLKMNHHRYIYIYIHINIYIIYAYIYIYIPLYHQSMISWGKHPFNPPLASTCRRIAWIDAPPFRKLSRIVVRDEMTYFPNGTTMVQSSNQIVNIATDQTDVSIVKYSNQQNKCSHFTAHSVDDFPRRHLWLGAPPWIWGPGSGHGSIPSTRKMDGGSFIIQESNKNTFGAGFLQIYLW